MTDTGAMQDDILTPEIIRKKLECRQQEDGGIVHTYRDAAGEITSAVYHLYPGITLIHKEVHRPHFLSNWRMKPERGLLIEHCSEGLLECQAEQDRLYHAPGDVIVFRRDCSARELRYPLGHFRSLAVSIDLDEVSADLAVHLDKIGFNIDALVKKYQLDSHFFCVLKEDPQLENIFQQMSIAPGSVKITYWKLKVFELLLLLGASVPDVDERPKQRISRAQAAVAKAARQYLIEHPYERSTIDALAARFSVSPTHLKTGFRTVYGVSIKRFDREQKIRLAARFLRETDRPVGDIARQFGYVNTSKFSSAFQSIMGKTPHDYRAETEQEYT